LRRNRQVGDDLLWAGDAKGGLGILIAAGFEVSASEAGLYLWVTRHENCWQTVSALAELGIISVPGEFYGERGENFVRVSLTATDVDVERAVARLRNALG
jgi:aspartate/methionine/tyrosine aminotransferase